jgi:acetylornithine deacetylase/succinyl-diaminopimelate desuccinylase-like protein/gamma-glutamyl:cysteine ligase YbdK (ATP-grasp superfamily)
MAFDLKQFTEKYQLALESSTRDHPAGGLNGFELEWNLLDEHFRPLLTVGSGPARQSFVDYLRADCLPAWLKDFSQLEVFHWMIEWATRPYYSPRGSVYEGRLMEAVLANSLNKAGKQFGERLHYWHGNLLFLTEISHASIPGNWPIAKRRYLERCVDLYNGSLATAGIHVNLSLPDPLFTWDYMHLPASERTSRHLDQFKSEFYITASRLLRAFASLFIATSASTPLQAQVRGGRAVVVLTENDSIRNLTFPNPVEIDQPDLYRSYKDYKAVSYDLVQRGIRFGNNNWTPVRARSFAEPVERLISTTSDQLSELYARGLYSIGENQPPEEMARQIEQQNLLARINLPMGRVEIRTDDGGHPLDVDIANMTFKHLLLIRLYADPAFARSFRYDHEDITRARQNELLAARDGLRASIENPLTGKPVGIRTFLKWILDELRPMAETLGLWANLNPLVEMSEGGPNTAEKLRTQLHMLLGSSDEVSPGILCQLAEDREAQVRQDVEKITSIAGNLGPESGKLIEFIQHARDDARQSPDLPVRFRPSTGAMLSSAYPDKTAEIVDLAQHLIRIPSVTACPQERLEEVHRAATFVYDYLKGNGLEVRYFDGKYPAVYANFPGQTGSPDVLLSGHFDVVEPDPDDSQFTPHIEGDYLWGRGASDMKTVVASNLVWMKDAMQKTRSGPVSHYPSISLLLVGNEENGEAEAYGTPHVLKEMDLHPGLLIAGERTGEKGDELLGEICTENRGVLRFEVIGHGVKGHSGVKSIGGDLSDRLIQARMALSEIFDRHLTLTSNDGWQSQARFPFIQLGIPGVYNITPAEGHLGVEIRPIPQDDVLVLKSAVETWCNENGFSASFSVMENGIICSPDNSSLQALYESVRLVSGQEPKVGRKLAGTSARFTPGGQGVVWGQSGIGPHTRDERHFIPSIEPYYRVLDELAKIIQK